MRSHVFQGPRESEVFGKRPWEKGSVLVGWVLYIIYVYVYVCVYMLHMYILYIYMYIYTIYIYIHIHIHLVYTTDIYVCIHTHTPSIYVQNEIPASRLGCQLGLARFVFFWHSSEVWLQDRVVDYLDQTSKFWNARNTLIQILFSTSKPGSGNSREVLKMGGTSNYPRFVLL